MKNFCLALIVVIFSMPSHASVRGSAANGFFVFVKDASGFSRVNAKEGEKFRIEEFLRKGESVHSWQEMITVMHVKSTSSAKDFYVGLIKASIAACESVSAGTPVIKSSRGFEIVRGHIACGKSKLSDKGEYTNYAFVKNGGSMYILQTALRTSPYDAKSGYPKELAAKTAEWKAIWSSSFLCPEASNLCMGI